MKQHRNWPEVGGEQFTDEHAGDFSLKDFAYIRKEQGAERLREEAKNLYELFHDESEGTEEEYFNALMVFADWGDEESNEED